jgi:hypothetical protein
MKHALGQADRPQRRSVCSQQIDEVTNLGLAGAVLLKWVDMVTQSQL